MSKITLQEAITLTKSRTNPMYHKNEVARTGYWYKKGYYMKADGFWYSEVGGKEYRKYSLG